MREKNIKMISATGMYVLYSFMIISLKRFYNGDYLFVNLRIIFMRVKCY